MPLWQGVRGVDGNFGGSGLQPVNAAGTQVGVTSYGTTQFCGTGEAAAYTDVGAFYTWLRTTMNANAKEGANKRGNSSRLTQSFHFFLFEPFFSPVNALNQPI